jgi:hypothetical protein
MLQRGRHIGFRKRFRIFAIGTGASDDYIFWLTDGWGSGSMVIRQTIFDDFCLI